MDRRWFCYKVETEGGESERKVISELEEGEGVPERMKDHGGNEEGRTLGT